MKNCSKCKMLKPLLAFYIERKGKRKGMPTSQCKECCTKQSAKYYATNKEKARLAHRKWVNENKEKVAFHKAKSAYGITKEEYDSLRKECCICKSKDNLRIDHCHKKGLVRGMLCDSCNKGLGFFKDNPELLEKAQAYLSPDIFEKTYEPV